MSRKWASPEPLRRFLLRLLAGLVLTAIAVGHFYWRWRSARRLRRSYTLRRSL
ncbi:hypothetical protein [Minwuia thermotolerans]|uniref:hypothetical protein n=1 Tax=Minwuia thermotolerans TaxID=2056226 RepID=UPI0013DDF134|nr:hypothetical protein [Minwuia thermotolerans]